MLDISWLGHQWSSPFRGGIERMVQELVSGFSNSRGVELTLTASESAENAYRSKKRLEEFHLGEEPLFTAAGAFYKNIRTRAERIPRGLEKKALSFIARYAGRFLKPFPVRAYEKADIYHSPFSPLPKTPRSLRGPKRFLTLHDMLPVCEPELASPKFKERFLKVLASICENDFLICVSEYTRARVCEYLKIKDAGRIKVIYPGVSDFFFPVPSAEKRKEVLKKIGVPDEPYVLSLAYQKRKNIGRLSESFAALVEQQKIRGLRLVLAGNADPEDIGGHPQISFAGPVADEELRVLYSHALMFVYPSIYEGFGMPVLEAMKCGAPVIAGNVTSVPEAAGDAALLVDPRDSGALSQAMLDLYSSEAKRNLLIAKGFDRSSEFTWKKNLEETAAAYKAALSHADSRVL